MVVLQLGNDAGRYRLDTDAELVIGRGSTCDLVVEDPRISWQHCQLKLDASGVWVADLDSRNGVFVAGRRVTEATCFVPPFELQLGAALSIRVARVPGERRRTTLQTASNEPRFRVRASLNPPWAAVEQIGGGSVAVQVTAETRAVLLYVLGAAWNTTSVADSPEGPGWTDDASVIRAVWGKSAGDRSNRLKVLLHRVRTDFKSAGLPATLIERRGRFLRLRVLETLLH